MERRRTWANSPQLGLCKETASQRHGIPIIPAQDKCWQDNNHCKKTDTIEKKDDTIIGQTQRKSDLGESLPVICSIQVCRFFNFERVGIEISAHQPGVERNSGSGIDQDQSQECVLHWMNTASLYNATIVHACGGAAFAARSRSSIRSFCL
jgi:hypothetical protein